MMKNILSFFLALFLVFILLPAAPAYADVAPPPIPIVGGLGPFEYQSTNVQMAFERVEMEIIHEKIIDGPFTYYPPGVTVDAWFTMHNTSSQDETMRVVFPLDNINNCYGSELNEDIPASYTHLLFTSESFTVEVDGVPAETTTITTPHPHTGRGGCDSQQMHWAAFDVTFPGNEDVIIRVSYRLDGSASDAIYNVGYTLETGAAWKGPIGEAIIVFRFPYKVEDFILRGTTPGYETMENEIYWRYLDFEPSSKDNISVVSISPETWPTIDDSRHRIKVNPNDDVAWAKIAEAYSHIAHFHGPNMRYKEYNERAYYVYNEGLKANPNSPVLNAGYADLYLTDCCYYEPITPADMKVVRPYIEKALKYDPSNEKALELLETLRYADPSIAITVGPTFTPTLTATLDPAIPRTATSTAIPTRTITSTTSSTRGPRPTRTPTMKPTQPPTKTATAIPTQIAVAAITPSAVPIGMASSSSFPVAWVAIGIAVFALVAGWRKVAQKR